MDPNTICIYTDGSGIDGHIGAAAICPSRAKVEQQYLGDESQYNVFAAEIEAMCLAVKIAQGEPTDIMQCVIYSDSQAGIQAVTRPEQQSGQSIILSFLNSVEKLQQQRKISFSLVWVPGHMDIDGNERADEAAKIIARAKRSETHFPHRIMKSGRNVANLRKLKADWIKSWQNEKKDAKLLRNICKRPMVDGGPKLYRSLTSRMQISWLVRLRTEHCGLNKYLHRIGREESPICPCGEAEETVQHFLLVCLNYKEERQELRRKVGAGGMKLEKLLGSSKHIVNTLEFMKDTKRMEC